MLTNAALLTGLSVFVLCGIGIAVYGINYLDKRINGGDC